MDAERKNKLFLMPKFTKVKSAIEVEEIKDTNKEVKENKGKESKTKRRICLQYPKSKITVSHQKHHPGTDVVSPTSSSRRDLVSHI